MKRAGHKRGSGDWPRRLLKVVVVCALVAGVWLIIAATVDDRLWQFWKDREARGQLKVTAEFLNFLFAKPVPLLFLVWACLIGGPKSERWRLVAQVALSLLIVSIPVWVGKVIVPRYRPNFFEGANWRDSFVWGPLQWHGFKAQAFPSGDAAIAFAVAAVLSFHFPRFRVLIWVLAVGCGVSRFILKAHWPSDIFLGAVIGYVVGRLVLLITGDVRTDP